MSESTSASNIPSAALANGRVSIHAQRLLWAGFMAILAEGVGFGIRAGILGQWASKYGFTMTDLGQITGGGFTGFGIVIILSSFIADKVGYGMLMTGAFLLHAISAVVTLAAGFAFAQGGKPAALACLTWGMFLFALGNGLCEAVANPLVAALFKQNKSHYLNILHAGWPGGLILGSLAAYFLGGTNPVAWQIQMSLFLIPVVLYGGMLFGQRFPKSEASEHGVSYQDMLKELGTSGAALVCILLAVWLSPVLVSMFNLPPYAGYVVGGIVWLSFGFKTKFWPGYLIMFLLLIVHSLQGTVELGTDAWVGKITGAFMNSPQKGILLFLYISGLMFALRFFAGPIVERISPLGLLFSSTILSSIGLMLLGYSYQAWFCVIAATVYAVGKTFMWPTLLAVASEQFPKGGAIIIGTMGGVGMLSAGLLGGPGIGFNQDVYASKKLSGENPAVYARYKADQPNNFLGMTTTGLAGDKAAVLDDNGTELAHDVQVKKDDPNIQSLAKWWDSAKGTAPDDKPLVTEAGLYGGRMALRITAILPAIQAVLLLGILLYFKSRGGYKQVHIEGVGETAKEAA